MGKNWSVDIVMSPDWDMLELASCFVFCFLFLSSGCFPQSGLSERTRVQAKACAEEAAKTKGAVKCFLIIVISVVSFSCFFFIVFVFLPLDRTGSF